MKLYANMSLILPAIGAYNKNFKQTPVTVVSYTNMFEQSFLETCTTEILLGG